MSGVGRSPTDTNSQALHISFPTNKNLNFQCAIFTVEEGVGCATLMHSQQLEYRATRLTTGDLSEQL